MITGEQVSEYLVELLGDQQTGKSSHWQNHLSDFGYTEEGGLTGLSGFGGISEGGIKGRTLDWILQIPYKVRSGNYIDLYRVLQSAKKIAAIQKRLFYMDVLRQVLTVVLCKNKIPQFSANKTSLVIGDGFGTLASLLFLNTRHKIVSINLNEVLLTDYLYTRGIIPDEATVLVETESDLYEAIETESIRYICIRADNHTLLRNMKTDIAFNIVSMQEMNPDIVAQYFSDMRECKSESLYFYCCNRIEKELPDGTIVRFYDYPWSEDDEIILDELCPWNQSYYSRRPPFYHNYSGPVQHRIVKMK